MATLGLKALEPLRDAMGVRSDKCRVAEQNMVSVAAALAKQGLKVLLAAPIAPFMTIFEQVLNVARNSPC